MNRPLIYIGHPFGGDKTNLDKAEAWVAFLSAHFDALFWAPWIPLCRHWVDSGNSRRRGLELDMSAIDVSSGVLFVGGVMSPGMVIEMERAVSGAGKAKSFCVQNLTRYTTPRDLLVDKHEMDCQAQLFGRAA